MARDLYDELLAGEGPLKGLVDAARELREWRAGSLAQQEYQDGLHVDGDGTRQAQQGEGWSMAAQDSRRALPLELTSGDRAVVIARDASGQLYMELVRGDTVLINGVWLRIGERQPLDDVPASLSGVDADGDPVELN